MGIGDFLIQRRLRVVCEGEYVFIELLALWCQYWPVFNVRLQPLGKFSS